MKSFKEFITEADTPEIKDAKRVFTKLQAMYPDVPKFPIEFKNLGTRGSGYLETSRFKGAKYWNIKKMVINTHFGSYDPDYVVCHEFAHAILVSRDSDLKHGKKQDKLTYELAMKFHLV